MYAKFAPFPSSRGAKINKLTPIFFRTQANTESRFCCALLTSSQRVVVRSLAADMVFSYMHRRALISVINSMINRVRLPKKKLMLTSLALDPNE